MSADNWAKCPQCALRHDNEMGRRRLEVEAAYGKCSIEDFDELREALQADLVKDFAYTFREDWEIGVFNGTPELFISYRGSCTTCGLKVERRIEEAIFIAGEA